MRFPGARTVFFEQWHFRTDSSWQDKAKRPAWVEGIRRWARHVHKDLSLGYDEFTLHIYDEVSGGGIDTFVRARQLVREADPKVRVPMTVTPQITLKEVQRLDPAVDVWCPHMELYETRPEVLAFRGKTRKPVVPYYCAENKRYGARAEVPVLGVETVRTTDGRPVHLDLAQSRCVAGEILGRRHGVCRERRNCALAAMGAAANGIAGLVAAGPGRQGGVSQSG
ncbi:MAG: hypothetical protein Ct9H300mP1_38460 [Planctomycetaceae bacterium]|nr:MAG: hypothetical protein Ct9H300mP1_38460 [Planctomycetaceae bacterium]